MDIYLTDVATPSENLMFPSLPESIKIRSAAKYQTYDLIQIGTVKVPKGNEPDTISWSGVFFGARMKNSVLVRNWRDPKECCKALEFLRENGLIVRLLITETNINNDVTIESFEGQETGAYGNFEYTISFVRARKVPIYTTDEMNLSAYVDQSRSEPQAQTGGVYTVVAGDSLWKIAQQQLGAGTRWQEIYDLNVDTIEATAQAHRKSSSDHGHWIYPGEQLTLPAA